jgi:hypothetical protein
VISRSSLYWKSIRGALVLAANVFEPKPDALAEADKAASAALWRKTNMSKAVL